MFQMVGKIRVWKSLQKSSIHVKSEGLQRQLECFQGSLDPMCESVEYLARKTVAESLSTPVRCIYHGLTESSIAFMVARIVR